MWTCFINIRPCISRLYSWSCFCSKSNRPNFLRMVLDMVFTGNCAKRDSERFPHEVSRNTSQSYQQSIRKRLQKDKGEHFKLWDLFPNFIWNSLFIFENVSTVLSYAVYVAVIIEKFFKCWRVLIFLARLAKFLSEVV